MNDMQFDNISRFFTRRRLSRRRALAQGGAGLAAAGLAATGVVSVSTAQSATPVSVAPDAEHGPEMLFLQSFQSGMIVPKAGVDGRYTVTLEHGLGQTIYFSDRPDRIVGASPTDRFLKGMGFPDDNPPNAALVIETEPGVTDFAVVELFTPVYDPAGPTVTYEAVVLANWQDSLDLGFTAAPIDLATLAPTFGAAHLFIDDCPDADIQCMPLDGGPSRGVIFNGTHDGFCYSWWQSSCLPCQPWYSGAQDANDYWVLECGRRYPACGLSCIPVPICTEGTGWLDGWCTDL